MNKWDKRFIKMAYLVASWSKDPSTKCGAVIVDQDKRIISTGYNGFPQGTNDHPSIYEDREEKYRKIVHSEKNAILFARQSLVGYTLYVVPMPPCSQCAGMIIQSGISKVVTVNQTAEQQSRWGKDIASTQVMFNEAGVVLEYLSSMSE